MVGDVTQLSQLSFFFAKQTLQSKDLNGDDGTQYFIQIVKQCNRNNKCLSLIGIFLKFLNITGQILLCQKEFLKEISANFQNDLDKVTHKKALIFKIGQIAPFLGFQCINVSCTGGKASGERCHQTYATLLIPYSTFHQRFVNTIYIYLSSQISYLEKSGSYFHPGFQAQGRIYSHEQYSRDLEKYRHYSDFRFFFFWCDFSSPFFSLTKAGANCTLVCMQLLLLLTIEHIGNLIIVC